IVSTGLLCFSQDLVWKSAAPSPTQAASLLQAVCPSNAQSVRGNNPGSLPGCRVCPKYTTNGDPQYGVDTSETFDLRSVIYGSFTGPGVQEDIASFEGCEPHTTEFGGSILLMKRDDSWSMVRYMQSLITTACRTYHLKTGRDLLLCEGEDGHMDETSQEIYVCGFSGQNPPACPGVFKAVDTQAACGTSAVWGSIEDATLLDANGDGTPELSLKITVGQGTYPPKDGGSCLWPAVHSTVQKYRLDFLFEPKTGSFSPAPWSRASAEHLSFLFRDAEEKAREATIDAMHKSAR
ncbi:MAG: hypothetical protein WA374_20415, partial [Acidobacteriaceae bacterium]